MRLWLVAAPSFLILGLGGCAKSCEELSAEAREKSAGAMHIAIDAYQDGASTEKMASKLSGIQKDLIDLRSEMVNKNCPLTL